MKWKSQQQLQKIQRQRLIASPADNHEAYQLERLEIEEGLGLHRAKKDPP